MKYKILAILKFIWIWFWLIPAGICITFTAIFVCLAYGIEDGLETLKGLYDED